MPAINLPTINIGEGDFKSKETMENILDTLMKYRKELNYLLMNLDVDNMPTIGGLIGDINGNYSLLSQTVDGIYMQVGNIEGDLADFRVEVDNISATVTNLGGDIASLSIRADDITAMVGDNTGAIAALVITAQGIQTQVTNNKGDISTLTQTASGLQSQVTSLDSYTTSQITQLSSSISSKVSTTDYNGTNIVSLIEQTASNITLSASKINLNGITRVNKELQLGSGTEQGKLKFNNGVSIYATTNSPSIGYAMEFDAEMCRFNNIYTNFLHEVGFYGVVDFRDATNILGLELKFA